MSSKQAAGQSEEQGPTIPRAIIHKQVLDAAAAKPDASLETLASEVSGVSENLVERILDEYGDPAANAPVEPDRDDQDPAGHRSGEESLRDDGGEPSNAGALIVPSCAEVTPKQQEVLAAIHEHPDATQRDLGALLGVSGATVSVHANSIPGFEWEHRRAFSAAFIDANGDDVASPDLDSSAEHEPTHENESELLGRVRALEAQANDPKPVFSDAELAHRVVHACMASEHITEAEELVIIQSLMYE